MAAVVGPEVTAVAALRAAVDLLAAVDPGGLSVGQLQEVLPGLAGQGDRLAGVRDGLLAELDRRGAGRVPAGFLDDGFGSGTVSTSGWLREATVCGGPQAGGQVRAAGLLARLPRLAGAVVDGRVGHAQAMVLTRLLDRLGENELLDTQEQLVVLAAGRDPQWLAGWVREQIATYCEPELEASAEQAAARRYLQLRDNHDGTVSGRFVLPTGSMESLQTVLAALSRPAGLAESRSAGQRRADSLLDVFDLAARHGQLPEHGGLRPQVSYLLPAGWAAALTPPPLAEILAAAAVGTAAAPASLATAPPFEVTAGSPGAGHPGAGHPGPGGPDCRCGQGGWPGRYWCARGAWSGPQTRAEVEAVLCDARIDRLLLSPHGQVRGMSTLTDSVTASQRRALAARDGGCAAYGCTRPPAFCDAHHLRARADGGPTELANLVLLCRYHHRRWHHGKLDLTGLHAPWHDQPPTRPDPARTDTARTDPARPRHGP